MCTTETRSQTCCRQAVTGVYRPYIHYILVKYNFKFSLRDEIYNVHHYICLCRVNVTINKNVTNIDSCITFNMDTYDN